MPRLARRCRHSCPMRRWSGHDATAEAKAAAHMVLLIEPPPRTERIDRPAPLARCFAVRLSSIVTVQRECRPAAEIFAGERWLRFRNHVGANVTVQRTPRHTATAGEGYGDYTGTGTTEIICRRRQ